jgi:hypothetical protein
MIIMESKQLLLKVNGPYGKLMFALERQWLLSDSLIIIAETASVVEGIESMTSITVTSLAWVRSPGDALLV